MPLNVRGRHVSKDIFKPGERAQLSGSYRCDNCHHRGDETVVGVEEGDIFPMCSVCSDWDMGWRPVSPSRS